MGGSAWATDVPYTIGSTTSNWETAGSYSDSYTLAAGKTLTFTFSVDASAAASEGDDWKGYLAVIQESPTRHTLNANTYTFVRSMCDYNVKGTWNSGAIYNTNTYPSGAKYAHFVGADVTMTIKRISTYVLITTAITNGETTYYHYYQQNLGTTDDLYAFLCADWAELTLKGVTTTDNGLTEELYDFEAAKGSSNADCTTNGSIKVNGTYCDILVNTRIEMNARFAGQGGNKWTVHKDNALYNYNSGGRAFGILNLKAGDKVALTYSNSNNAPTFNGTPNVEESVSAGDAVASGVFYTIKTDGMLSLYVGRNYQISTIKIHTSAPVLSAPNGKVFNSMVESEGLYYPKYTFTSSDEGVTFYDGDGNDITSGYTFMTTDPVTVYAGKTGRTNSKKVTFSADKVGMILANSVNASSLDGTINYAGGSVAYGQEAAGTWAVPGVNFESSKWYYYTSNLQPASGDRTLSCSVLNANRIAVIKHQLYSNSKIVYDYLTLASNSVSYARYDQFQQYNLYVSPSEEVSVTIGSTGYSTFSSPVPLNFDGIDGLTAYVATTVADGKVTLSPVTTAPANTGLVLKGTAGASYNIPVTNSAATPASNLLVGCIVNTTVAADATSGFNNYVLVNEGGTAKFQSLVENGATVTAGKAFLKNGAYVPSPARLNIVFEDEGVTAIKAIDASEISGAQADGKYLEKGKIVIVKNGVKFNANGQKVK